MIEALDAVRSSEAATVRTLTYYLKYEAKKIYDSKTSDFDDYYVGSTQSISLRRTWPFVVNALIRRPLNEDDLQSVHDAVACSAQKPG